MRPTVRGLEETYGEQLTFKQVSVALKQGQQEAAQYQIRHAPSVVFLNADGTVRFRFIGLIAAERLRRAVEQIVAVPQT